jgi:hypothetical protein
MEKVLITAITTLAGVVTVLARVIYWLYKDLQKREDQLIKMAEIKSEILKEILAEYKTMVPK